MRGWMMTALVVTFLSGASSGFVAGRASAPEPVEKTWIDGAIEQLRREGVTAEADLAEARKIYEGFQERVMALKGRVNELFQDNLRAFELDAEEKIRDLRNRATVLPDGDRGR